MLVMQGCMRERLLRYFSDAESHGRVHDHESQIIMVGDNGGV